MYDINKRAIKRIQIRLNISVFRDITREVVVKTTDVDDFFCAREKIAINIERFKEHGFLCEIRCNR